MHLANVVISVLEIRSPQLWEERRWRAARTFHPATGKCFQRGYRKRLVLLLDHQIGWSVLLSLLSSPQQLEKINFFKSYFGDLAPQRDASWKNEALGLT